MEDIRNLCSDFMERKICLRNVIDFYLTSKQYNLPSLSKRSVTWIAENLLLLEEGEVLFDLLKRIPIELMTEVISKPDLIVVQLEQDVFLMLLKWVFLRHHTDYEFQQTSRLLDDAYSFFTSDGQSFLESSEGLRYAPAFQAIRWEYIINVYKTTERMMRDRVVPEAWLGKVFCQQWLRLLHTHELQTQCIRSNSVGHGHSNSTSTASDSASASRIRVTLTGRESTLPVPSVEALRPEEPGPRSDLPDDVFWATSERCGRRMHSGDTTCSWRWTGFHFGFDVVVKYKRRTFSIIRFTESHSTEGSISHAPHLRLMISLRVKSLSTVSHETTSPPDDLDDLVDMVNESVGNPEVSGEQNSESCITSGVLRLSLEENVLIDVLRLPDHVAFPVVVAANILRYDPIGWIPTSDTDFGENA